MAAETNSPVDGMEYFIVFFFTAVDSGEQQRETRVIQHRSMNGGKLHEGKTRSWVCSHSEDHVRPEETLKGQNTVGVY